MDGIAGKQFAVLAALPKPLGPVTAGGAAGSLDLGQFVAGLGDLRDITDGPPPDVTNLGPVDPRFRINLDVTDLATGETGRAEFAGTLDRATTQLDTITGRAAGSATLFLGDSIYQFDIGNRESENTNTVYATYTVTPAGGAVNTPEPATVVSAALGLATLVGAARRRKAVVAA